LLDQPAKKIVYIFKDDNINNQNTPKLTHEIKCREVNCINAQELKLKIKPKRLQRINKILLRQLHVVFLSFNNNFKPSAITWKNPQAPTTEGPCRRCKPAKSLRSATVNNATASKDGISTDNVIYIKS
jgi:hypothetical protein